MAQACAKGCAQNENERSLDMSEESNEYLLLPRIIETERCTGHCCRRFSLPIPWMKVKMIKKAIARGIQDIPTGKPFRTWNIASEDFQKTMDMLIPLGEFREEVQFQRGHRSRKNEERQYHYTCRHYDGRNCTIYESRPAMCRNYPDGRKCQYRGCTRRTEEETICKMEIPPLTLN